MNIKIKNIVESGEVRVSVAFGTLVGQWAGKSQPEENKELDVEIDIDLILEYNKNFFKSKEDDFLCRTFENSNEIIGIVDYYDEYDELICFKVDNSILLISIKEHSSHAVEVGGFYRIVVDKTRLLFFPTNI